MGYFTVEVKPTILASHQAGNSSVYAADDVLFDWTSFQVPKGAAKCLGITVIFRGKNGGPQTVGDVDFYLAKTVGGVAPATMGLSNGTASSLPVVSNHIIGMIRIDDGASYGEDGWDRFSVASSAVSSEPSMIGGLVVQGEPETGNNVGYDTLYLGAIAGAAFDFGTTVLARGGEAAGVLVVETDKGDNDDPDADLIFAVGDTLHSATDDVLGKVASIAAFGSSKQDITFAAVTEDIIADNEEIFNVNPIRVILSFER